MLSPASYDKAPVISRYHTPLMLHTRRVIDDVDIAAAAVCVRAAVRRVR